MRILAIEQETKPFDASSARDLLRREAAQVWTLRKKGVIRDIWFTRRGRAAVIMLECRSENEARRQLASLPLVRGRFITFDVMALREYDGFDRLID